MSEQLDGFHFGIFAAENFDASATNILDGFGRMSGHVDTSPHELAVSALKEVSRLGWPEDGEYIVVGVRLRDHMVVKQHGWVKRGFARREALTLTSSDDEALIEGELLEARA